MNRINSLSKYALQLIVQKLRNCRLDLDLGTETTALHTSREGPA